MHTLKREWPGLLKPASWNCSFYFVMDTYERGFGDEINKDGYIYLKRKE